MRLLLILKHFLTGGGGETTIQDDAGSIIFPLLHVPMPFASLY